MELAKIRNKAQQAVATEPVQEAVAIEPATAQPDEPSPPALSLPDNLLDIQPTMLSFPGPAPVRPAPAESHFDPLARILAGREQDCAVTGSADAALVHEQQSTVPEVAFEEFLCFRLGDEEYGINIMEIKEIIKPRELTEVPRTPGFVDGVLSLRGVIVPVFTMRKRLGMSLEYDGSQERIVIVRCGDGLHGLRVDRVTDVVKISKTDREVTPAVLEGVAREFVSGIGRSGKRMLIILDICKVVDTALGEVT
ncbi:purine-binding chemotaxis protein CheW [Trichlorobacter thiogenes]|uniref:Purine-binding chemotaxis protein CheW n=1 Tax=Trichlorobacter thiogenes TaxID=115783 RepID=A0A1T4PZM4_9BACT|nr:chemotaxis protein CheW [Trichlorobacter thiogenes]SJZ96899.1 purine-binding chemotaxis protein CheW [Trichlorobacter thiogenes]